MGYEVKVFIIRPALPQRKNGETEWWGEVLSEIDLSGVGSKLDDLSRVTKGDPVFIFGLDGHKKYLTDRYDKRLTMLEPSEVMTALALDKKRKETNPRHDIAMSAIIEAVKSYGDTVKIVLFGY